MSPPESPAQPKVTPDPSSRWVANLQAGVDVEESFRQLVQEYGAAIERFFHLRRFSPQETKDLAQDTFINAYLGIHTFRSDASLKTWLLGVAQNVWRNELRRRSAAKRAKVVVPLEDPESGEQVSLLTEADELINALLRKERRQIIVQELRKFPPQMRRCMLLRVLQDLKYREIAAVLRISTQTVKSHLFEARQRLKDVLEEVELHD